MKDNQNNFLWKKIQLLRKEKWFTQDGLARKADISYTSITKIEIWVIKEPSVFVIAKIAKVLEVTIESLLDNK